MGMEIIANYCTLYIPVYLLSNNLCLMFFVSHHILSAVKDVVHFFMLNEKIVKTRGAPTVMFLLDGTEKSCNNGTIFNSI